MACCSGLHKIGKDHAVIHLLKKLGQAITADQLLNIYHAFPADACMIAFPTKKQNMINLSRERVTKACVFYFIMCKFLPCLTFFKPRPAKQSM